jgi:hypothetical protein
VLFVSNHQTYFADVVAMFHVFNASLSGRQDSIKNIGYLWNPKLNLYFVAAKETMQSGLLPKILAYAGSVSIERTWRAEGQEVNRQVKMSDVSNIKKEYKWSIFIDGAEVKMDPGDMIIYNGIDLPHWRKKFRGIYHTQVFFHYTDEKILGLTPDTRPRLGLPDTFKAFEYEK